LSEHFKEERGRREEKRREDGGECAVTGTILIRGDGVEVRKVYCAEGSQLVPVRPSDKGTLITR
jgi:hypothetical protein